MGEFFWKEESNVIATVLKKKEDLILCVWKELQKRFIFLFVAKNIVTDSQKETEVFLERK